MPGLRETESAIQFAFNDVTTSNSWDIKTTKLHNTFRGRGQSLQGKQK